MANAFQDAVKTPCELRWALSRQNFWRRTGAKILGPVRYSTLRYSIFCARPQPEAKSHCTVEHCTVEVPFFKKKHLRILKAVGGRGVLGLPKFPRPGGRWGGGGFPVSPHPPGGPQGLPGPQGPEPRPRGPRARGSRADGTLDHGTLGPWDYGPMRASAHRAHGAHVT